VTALQVKVSGVLAGARGRWRSSASTRPAAQFSVGERLSPGVRLTAIEGDGVEIERGAKSQRVKLDTLPQRPALPRLTRP
jgi:general secretion pathway protein C